MLLSFRFANHGSFRVEQELSLYRVDSGRSAWPRPDVTPVAAIYGANAAGKSALVEALAYVRAIIRHSYRSWSPGGSTHRLPFLLDANSRNEPSRFDIEFVAADGFRYQYGFAVDDVRVVNEFLYTWRTHRRSTLFERESTWHFGPSFRGPAQLMRETTQDGALFLSAAAAAGNATILPAYTWLSSAMQVYAAADYPKEHRRVIKLLENKTELGDRLEALLRASDLGVDRLTVAKWKVARRGPTEVLERCDHLIGDEENELVEKQLQISRVSDDGVWDLPFSFESDGTKALISFLSVALHALSTGSTCIFDEIDTSLHPHLVAELVEVFQDVRTNPHQAQLVFTTHDASLLDRSEGPDLLLARDQVWIVEKDAAGVSSLFGISEFGPRKEENLRRRYLTGRYGGVPQLSLHRNMLAAASG